MLPEATWVRPPKKGPLHRWRRALQAATSVVFVAAPFVDLLRFDLRGGALILGGASFGLADLQAVYMLVLLFVVVVFAGALLYGRIYCGWMCPQTTLSEIVATFERWAAKRVKSPALKHVPPILGALGMSAFVAASLVSYFLHPSQRLAPPRLAVISWVITTAVIGFFLWLRHRFCIGICPYGLLQNIIQDSRTLGVAFDKARRSECTNCLLCVRACFVGVDIREASFDPRCLNCGDCIAATQIAKRCPEQPLISFRYGSEPSRWPALLGKAGILDVRRALVVAVVLLFTALTVLSMAKREDFEADVAAQYERTVADPKGNVRNTYRLSLRNRLRQPVRVRIEVHGQPAVAVESPGGVIELAPGEQALRDVVLSAPCDAVQAGTHEITFRIAPEGQPAVPDLPTFFFVPKRSTPCAGLSVSPSPHS